MPYSLGVQARSVPVRGGYISGFYGAMSKLNFATEIIDIIKVQTVDVTNSIYQASGVSNKNVAGYLAGGGTWNTGASAAIYRISYLNDSIRAITPTLATSRLKSASLSNSGVAGYVVAGSSNSSQTNLYNSTDKLNFSNEVVTTLGATISSPRYGLAGCSNSGVAGYIFGGSTSGTVSGSTVVNTIQKLNFSSDSISTLGYTMTYAGYSGDITSNSGVAGYTMSFNCWLGGNYDNSPTYNVCDKLNYSTDVKSQVSGYNLGNIDNECSAISSQSIAGYHMGYGGGGRMYRFNFASETVSQMSTTAYNGASAGISNSLG